jgi:type II secretion system protein I
MTTRTRYRSRGLTLLEVLVAMTVLAIGIVSVLGAVSACLRASDGAAAYSRAALLAQQVAGDISRNTTLEPDALQGTFDSAATGFSWAAIISDADEQGLYPVKITVAWDHDARHFTLHTLLRPHELPAPLPAEATAGAGAGADVEDGTGTGAGSGTGTGAGTGTGRRR